jgi:UDP-N-acetylglucosamine diphosphorylase / glucose-1-phosphate thymidylyltransferase / UDP-N-acetylgalactosamine diphosphorylase / glucosamine-1-phosphate N-acetyltransferase / galactosamine-1-phosphate N-acetyltransferase
MFKASDFFTLPDSLPFKDFFDPSIPPWAWVEQIQKALAQFDFAKHPLKLLIPPGFTVGKQVYLDPSVKLPPYGVIEGPAYIGAHTELRPGVYIRQNVIVGAACVLGNACEYKNCLLMDGVATPHYNYVGDSILGNKAHMAAGSILANLRLDKAPITIKTEGQLIQTGLRKLGALIGEGAEIGCNAVLQPGTLLGKNAIVMPTLAFGGYLAPGTRAKR